MPCPVGKFSKVPESRLPVWGETNPVGHCVHSWGSRRLSAVEKVPVKKGQKKKNKKKGGVIVVLQRRRRKRNNTKKNKKQETKNTKQETRRKQKRHKKEKDTKSIASSVC